MYNSVIVIVPPQQRTAIKAFKDEQNKTFLIK